jgi:hypothetical protein
LPTGDAPVAGLGGDDIIPTLDAGPDIVQNNVGSTGANGENRGFIIMIKVTSPNKNAVGLVESSFCGALRNIKPSAQRPRMEYEVKKASVALQSQIKQDGARKAEVRKTYDAVDLAQKTALQELQLRAAIPPAPAPRPGQPGAEEDPLPFMDRLVPDEDVRNDWDVTVVIFVKLDPVYTPETPKPQASAQ